MACDEASVRHWSLEKGVSRILKIVYMRIHLRQETTFVQDSAPLSVQFFRVKGPQETTAGGEQVLFGVSARQWGGRSSSKSGDQRPHLRVRLE